MLITLFTDASHCAQTKIGAFAIWAKADGRTIRRAGLFQDRVPDSSLAETQALVNGLCIVLSQLTPPPGSKIIAQTDCEAAISALTGTSRKAKSIARYAPARAIYESRVTAAGITVEFRHVRAHKGTVTPRNAVNTWCDKACRQWMRAGRAAATGKEQRS